jgi:hypothetical protein
VIKLGVVPVEIVEPAGTGGSAGTTTGIVGTGVTTTTVGVGVAGGTNVNLDTNRVAVGAVGLVTLELSHAVTKRATRRTALIRVIPHV